MTSDDFGLSSFDLLLGGAQTDAEATYDRDHAQAERSLQNFKPEYQRHQEEEKASRAARIEQAKAERRADYENMTPDYGDYAGNNAEWWGGAASGIGNALQGAINFVTGNTASGEAHDPNSLLGPAGYGTNNYIAASAAASEPLPYQINFENDPIGHRAGPGSDHLRAARSQPRSEHVPVDRDRLWRHGAHGSREGRSTL